MDCRKIAIIGPESTGKTSLAQGLAMHLNGDWVPEFARAYLTELGRPYTLDDVNFIAQGQIDLENEASETCQGWLVCDTNLWVIRVWMEYAYGFCPDWILSEISKREYHVHVLTKPDIPYEADPLREHPELRAYFFEIYEGHLKESNTPYLTVGGSMAERIEQVMGWLKRNDAVSFDGQ